MTFQMLSEKQPKIWMKMELLELRCKCREGDFLIGKITPKVKQIQRLKKIIACHFSVIKKRRKDASLKVLPSIEGVVIDKQLYATC